MTLLGLQVTHFLLSAPSRRSCMNSTLQQSPVMMRDISKSQHVHSYFIILRVSLQQ